MTGAVLADQVKSIDRGARKFSIAGRAPDDIVADGRAKVAALLDFQA